MLSFDPQTNADGPVLAIAFTNLLNGRTPASCAVQVKVFERSSVVDPDPASSLAGAAYLSTEPMTIDGVSVPAGQAVCQAISPGRLVGCTYVYRFIMTFTDGTPAAQDASQSVNEYSPP